MSETVQVCQLNTFENARTFINPELSAKDASRIQQADPERLRVVEVTATSLRTAVRKEFFSGNSLTAGGGVIGVTLLFGNTTLAAPALGLWILMSSVNSVRQRQNREDRRVASLAVTGYVRTEWLERPFHAPLLAAEAAVETMLGAQSVQQGRIDLHRIETRFPQMIWEAARTLVEVSSLRAATQELATPEQAEALKSVAALALERLGEIKRCAAAVQEADDQYLRLVALEKIESSGVNAQITDLLARTAVHDMDMDEIRAMSAQARAVTEAYQKAVDMALDSINHTLELT